MKKLFLLVAVVAMVLPGCKKIEESIDATNARIDKLEQETIPSIDEQIAAINVSLDALDTMDKELKGYIDGLQATATNLQEQINATNTKIDEVKTALQNEISTAKSDVLAKLDAVKAELETELATINATIETLKAKDAELDQKIADLKSYVDTELGKTTDWVNATFATLEQYNALVAEVTVIKAQIVAINDSIADLETRLTTKINEDIANAVSTLNSTIQQKVKEITEAYTAAVKTAKEELTAAYIAAIATAIANLETSLRSWVGEQLAGYYTIAEIDAKIAELQKAIADGDSALQEELNKLKSQLETTKQEITEAYKKAIKEAIETNNGVIDQKIASEIAAVNKRIDEEIATINAKIEAIEARLDNVEAQIEELLSRIQSLSYIPTYDDNKATLKYNSGASQVTLDFKVSPKDAVAELAKIWEQAVKVDAVYTETRAVSFVDLPIVKFDADTENGIISVIASGENLSEDLFAGLQSTSVALSISDDNSSVTSEYIPIVTKEVKLSELFVPANQIWYTSTDGNVVEPARADVFDAKITSNKYKNGLGIIRFDAPVTQMYIYAFCNSETNVGAHNLETIILPNGVQEIGEYAFYDCSSLKSVTIPPSVTRMRGYAFGNCSNLTRVDISDLSAWCKITFSEKAAGNPLYNGARLYLDGNEVTDLVIPSDITELKFGVFYGCSSLTSVIIPESVSTIYKSAFAHCANLTDVVISNSVTSRIGTHIFSNCSSLTNVTLSENITLISDYMFQDCSSLTNINIPNGVTLIGEYAFHCCSSLTSIDIPDGVTSIGDLAFNTCSNLASVTIPNSVASIGRSAFWRCALTSVSIPDSVVELGSNAFCACEKLKTFYGKFASEDNRCLVVDGVLNSFAPSGLTEYTIPDGVTKIGNYAFDQCSCLTNIAIPNSVTSIGYEAFYKCTSLTSITIPDSVTEIGRCAFYGCKKLASVYCEPTTPPTGGSSMFASNATGRKIYVPRASVDAYKSADLWKGYSNYILGYDF
ncbi:MAG: hypothetical protein E7129_07630 [Rikenellaceae bacterium]|nr:hypothetical protein [Rikenellaceae bacterium]